MVCNEDIEAAEDGHRGLDQGAASSRGIQLLFHRVASGGAAALVEQGLGSVLRHTVAEDDPRAGLREEAHGLRADAARAAGDEGNFAVELQG